MPPKRAHSTSEEFELPAISNTAVDFAILTALKVERQAVCSALGFGLDQRIFTGNRWYWRGELHRADGSSYQIVVAQPTDAGQVEATALTKDVLHRWKPTAALLVGIAASADPRRARLGDVVVGKSVWYYEHGKVTPEGTRPQPEMMPAASRLLSHLTGMQDWDGKVGVKHPDGTEDKSILQEGVIASGEKVIADAMARDHIAAGHRKIVAIAMEDYGFSRAIWQSDERVDHMVIRGICDDGSPTKDDRWHEYAAAAAAMFTKHFLSDLPRELIGKTRRPVFEPQTLEERPLVKAPPLPAVRKHGVLVCLAYALDSQALSTDLSKYLSMLKEKGAIGDLSVARIKDSEHWLANMAERLRTAHVILLVLSPEFGAHDHIWKEEIEMLRKRHDDGSACVIPIVPRATDARLRSFAGLKPLPPSGKDITSTTKDNEVWLEVVAGIRVAIMASQAKLTPPPSPPSYLDAVTRSLAEQIAAIRARREAFKDIEAATGALDSQIIDLTHKLREGGQLRAGDTLGDGRYLLLNEAGRGGFAVVWEAWDIEKRERVAVKVLHANLAGPLNKERFFRGARAMSNLAHKGIVRVLQSAQNDGGYHYFVMEFIAGDDLRRAVLKKSITGKEAITLILQVGEAIAFAHARKLIHRDVKPANILLDPSGTPRLTDFDLVWAEDTTGGTRTGGMGTVVYAAPECTERPQDVDPRADVYSLGMTAVFALRGADLTLNEMLQHRLPKIFDSLSCPDSVKGVLKKATDPDMESRHTSMLDFCTALQTAIHTSPWAAHRPLASVTFGTNSNTLVLGSEDGLIELWRGIDLPRPRPVLVEKFEKQLKAVSSLAMSPDGLTLATTSSSRMIQLWAIANPDNAGAPRGEERTFDRSVYLAYAGLGSQPPSGAAATVGTKTLNGHAEAVQCLAWSPNGRILASGSTDATIRLWDVANGDSLGILKGHRGEVRSLAWSLDGAQVASASSDHTVRLWEGNGGRELRVFQSSSTSIPSIAFRQDGRSLMGACGNEGVWFWPCSGGTNTFSPWEHAALVRHVVWSPDVTTLAASSEDEGITLWNVPERGGEPIVKRSTVWGREGKFPLATFSPSGTTLAAVSDDGAVWLWDLATGTCRRLWS